ncbi:MAG: hypothetical protein AAFP13_03745 [Pseudomonadota bacterium]
MARHGGRAERPEKGATDAREDRLKKALKANMARRKAQARARAATSEGVHEDSGGTPPEQKGE